MARLSLLFVVGVGLVAALATSALAEPKAGLDQLPAGTRIGTSRVMVVATPDQFTGTQGAAISNVLYLDRCSGGCVVTGSDHFDARNRLIGGNLIPNGVMKTLTEFANAYGQTGTTGTCPNNTSMTCTTANETAMCGAGNKCDTADTEWAAVMQCMKEVYSPFDLVVTDAKPVSGNYTETLIAGQPTDIGLPTSILGIAPAHTDCLPHDNVTAFSFANHEPMQARAYNICWTAAQESAHHFGLDHEYQFVDGSSACNDPMTYRNDCGGEKFFRNVAARCGEDMVRDCFCGGSQISHAKLLSVFGPGTSLIAPPTTSIVVPTAGTPVSNGFVTQAKAFSKRGVGKMELWLNGYKWAEAKGAMFGATGQLESVYPLTAPASVPNGVIDIVVKAYDDLGIKSDSATVTVMKGAACANAVTDCAKGQKCSAGKCFWDAPTGNFGDACTFNQFCTSGICSGTADTQICTMDCIVGVASSCPVDYTCAMTNGANGICFPIGGGGGGCCSVGGGTNSVWAHMGLGAVVLGLLSRRRRRR